MPLPTTSVIDDFNRASLGANWGALTASALGIIASTLLAGTNSGGYSNGYYNVTTYAEDQEVWIDIDTLGAQYDDFALLGRIQSPGGSLDAYGLYVEYRAGDGSDVWGLFKYSGGSWSQIGSTQTQNIASGDRIWLTLEGSTLTGYHIRSGVGTQIIQATGQTDITGAGYLGVDIRKNTMRLDNFGGGALGGGAGTIDQLTHLWRADDGSESGASGIGAAGDNLTRPVLTPVRLREQLVAAGDPLAITPRLEYRKKRTGTLDPWRHV